MLLLKRYKKGRSGRAYWQYKIIYRCPFTNKQKTKKRGGFKTQAEAEAAALEIMGYLRQQ